MNEFEVVAQPRQALGTSSSRRLRRTGWIPGVFYGGNREVLSIALEERRINRQLENETFAAHILTMHIDGRDADRAVLKAVARHPVTGRVIHVDFQRIDAGSELRVHIPLHFVNEELCVGRKAGGVVTHLLVEVEIGCLPKDLPEYIEVDMTQLGVGESVHLSELALPAGVRLMTLVHNLDNDQAVVSVLYPQKLDMEDAAAGEAGPAGTGSEAS